MKILWVHNFSDDFVSSGVFMYTLFDELRDMGVDVTLHYTGYLRGPVRMIKAARKIREVSEGYDLVHVQWGSACGFLSSFVRTPKILTLRGTDLLGLTTGRPWHRMHGLICRFLTWRSLPSYSHVIVMSRRMRQELKRMFNPRAEVEVLPSGINLEHFQPMDRMEARQRLGEENNKAPWVLFSSLIGEKNPVKRAPLAFDAFAQLKQLMPEAQLKLMTGIPHDKVPLWINACDVVLLTSTREGWPNVIKEALACNVPFVSTDVSNLAAIAEEEQSCYVVEPTPQALFEGLVASLQSENRHDLNLRRHVENMDVRKIASQLKELYETILHEGT